MKLYRDVCGLWAALTCRDKYIGPDYGAKMTANNNTVKRYHKFMTGMPAVETWGDLTTMLDAVLCNGFNAKTPTAISRVDTTVTVACVDHGYEIGQVLVAAGANEPDYNGEHRVTYITTGTYNYELPVGTTAPSSASTLTNFAVKVAPLGFEIHHTGIHRRVYRTLDTVNTNRPLLRVDDGLTFSGTWDTRWSKYAKITMASAMSDVDTFVGFKSPLTPDTAWPEANEKCIPDTTGASRRNGWFRWYFRKDANAYDTTINEAVMARWDLVGDSRGFHFFPSTSNYDWGCSHYSFVEFDSYVPGDAGNVFLQAGQFWGSPETSSMSEAMYYSGAADNAISRTNRGRRLLCDHTGFVQDEPVHYFGPNWGDDIHKSGYNANIPYPNPADFSIILSQNQLYGQRSGIRGVLPGIYTTPHARPVLYLTVLKDIPSLPGREFLSIPLAVGSTSTYGMIFVDTVGPWREV